MIFDLLFWLVDQVVTLFSTVLPSLPASIVASVNGLTERMSSIARGLPYGYLMPWALLGTAAVILPTVYGTSITIRVIRRVFGWVRSRGGSDE